MVERTASYERATSPVATLRREQMLDRKIEREIREETERRSTLDLPRVFGKVRLTTPMTDRFHSTS
jgi:hypothetical protein